MTTAREIVAPPCAAPPDGEATANAAALVRVGHSFVSGQNWEAALGAFQSAHKADPANLGVLNEIGYLLLRLGRAAESEAAFRAIIARAAAHAGALAGLGYALRQQGARGQALAQFEAAEASEPGRVDLTIEFAHELRAARRFEEAEAAYRRALASAPEHGAALTGLAQALRGRGDSAGALFAFESAARADPDNVELRNAIGYLLRDLKRPHEAEAVFRGILEQAPGHNGARLGLAFVLAECGELAQALQIFQAASLDDPGNEPIRFQIARLLGRLRRLDEAEAAFRRIVEAAPDNVGAMTELARIAMARGDPTAACATLNRAIAIRPLDSSLRVELGWLAREISRADEASESFRVALDRAPTNAAALCGLGWLAMDSHRLDEARTQFDRAREAAPRDVSCQMALGHLARRRCDRAAALESFEAALAIDPGCVEAKLEIAAELRDRGDFPQAREMIESVIGSNPNDVSACLHLAQWHLRLGDPAAALLVVEPVLQRDSAEPRAYLAAAAARLALGQPRQAEELVDRALKLDPRNLEALIRQADSAFASERFEDALQICQLAVAAHPGQVWPYLQAARAASELGDDAHAAGLLEDAERCCGSHPEIGATRIQLARLARDWPRARALIDGLRGAEGAGFFVWTERMLVALATGDFSSAEEGLDRAPVCSTRDAARVHLFRAEVLEARRRYDEAIEQYFAAARLDPVDSWTQSEMARACMIGLDLDAAAESLRRSVRLDASGHILRRQTLNASQHHLGQVIDEFLLDRDVLRAMRAAQRHAAEEQIAALGDVVLRNPDHTAPAILLLIALRRNGDFARVRDRGDAPGIPKRIVQFWDSGEPPRDLCDLMRTWRDLNPNHEYVLFDDSSARAFLARSLPLNVSRAFVRARHPAQRADIFRLGYLSVEGGFYLDADDRCLAPLEEFAPAGVSLALYQENYGTIGSDVIGAAADHPIIARALALAVDAVNHGDRDTLWLSTGPGVLTRAFAHAVVGLVPDVPDWRRGAIIHEHFEVQRIIGLHCPVRYKRTDKHWLRAKERAISAA